MPTDDQDDIRNVINSFPPEETDPELIKEGDKDRYLRALAEIDNLRKRKAREIKETRDAVKAQVLRDLLPIIDNIERALEATLKALGPEAVEQIREGIQHMLDHARHTMEELGVKGFATVGQAFAAELMQAVAELPSRELPPSTVVNEITRGYMLGDRLLRPAEVVVSVADEERALYLHGSLSPEQKLVLEHTFDGFGKQVIEDPDELARAINLSPQQIRAIRAQIAERLK